MKILKFYLTIASIVIFAVVGHTQENCKVLVPGLNGSYVGKCKKGFAHGQGKAIGTDTYVGSFKKGLPNGKGVYTWSNGDKYDGYWVYGQRDGEGIFTFKYDGKDSIQNGVWDNGLFKGKKLKKPIVTYKEFVTRYNFRRDGDGTTILIDLKLNGQSNIDILDFSMISTSGTNFNLGRSYGIENIEFPVLVKIKYISWNAAHSSRHNATFEFEIYEAGHWQVDITN